MWTENGLHVRKEDVRLIPKELDPRGVGLSPKLLCEKGPIMFFHFDSYDNLKPFGICINSCMLLRALTPKLLEVIICLDISLIQLTKCSQCKSVPLSHFILSLLFISRNIYDVDLEKKHGKCQKHSKNNQKCYQESECHSASSGS